MSAARWSPTMKRLIVGVLVVAVLFLAYRAGDIVRPFLWAAILGYILLPVVRAFENRLTNHRGRPDLRLTGIVHQSSRVWMRSAFDGSGRVII